MSDMDKTLEILIKLGFVGEDRAAAAKAALEAQKKTVKELADEELASSQARLAKIKEEGDALVVLKARREAAVAKGEDVRAYDVAIRNLGDSALSAHAKTRGLYRMMGRLDRVVPGLGEAFELGAESIKVAGESAEGAAVGFAELDAALNEVILTLGPLAIAILAIEAASEYWDIYKEKVKAAAEANSEACKKIQDDTHAAMKAVQELDAAMNPKQKNIATQDEESLKRQQTGMNNAADRQAALNEVEKEKELKDITDAKEASKQKENAALEGATDEAQKKAIRDQFAKDQAALDAQAKAITEKFEILGKKLDDWRNQNNASIEGGMASTMEVQLKQLQDASDRITTSKEFHDAFQKMKTGGDDADYKKYQAELSKNADEAKALREKLDELSGKARDDASQATFKRETNRMVFTAKGEDYGAYPPGAPTNTRGTPDPSKTPYARTDQGMARHDFAQLEGAYDILRGGGQLDQKQEALLGQILQAATGHAVKHDKMLEVLRQINASNASRDRAFDQIVSQISNSGVRGFSQ